MKIMEKEWETFKEAIPKGAPEIQIQEMKKAFFGGALSTILLMMNIETDMEFKEIADEVNLFWEVFIYGRQTKH